jgi:hypothetical protein
VHVESDGGCSPRIAAFEPGFVPLADRLDTASELLFVYSFP